MEMEPERLGLAVELAVDGLGTNCIVVRVYAVSKYFAANTLLSADGGTTLRRGLWGSPLGKQPKQLTKNIFQIPKKFFIKITS